MTPPMVVLDQANPDEKTRRVTSLVVGAPVHIATIYYGTDLFGLPGVLVSLNPHDLYPYHVEIERVPGFDSPVVRCFAWYELSV